jgi:predicted transcriptional regulator
MSDTGDPNTARPAWMYPGDEAILRFLRAERAEYPSIIANRVGMHVPYVEERLERLAERELAEPVSGEVVYRITEEGRSVLD